MVSKNYRFNYVNIDASDGVLENLFGLEGYPVVNLKYYDIEKLKSSLFRDNDSIEKVILPETLKEIGEYTFYSCRNLNEIIIPESVVELYSNFLLSSSVYYDQDNNWKNNVFCKDGWAISNDNPATIVIPAGIKNISADFGKSGLINITIPDSVVNICKKAFDYCSNLKTVRLSNSIDRINEYTFQGCTSLENIELPNSIKYIKTSAFSRSGLTKITIPNQVLEIDSYAFESCSNLVSVILPSSITKIGSYAFSDCSKLSSIVYSDNVEKWKAVSKAWGWSRNVATSYVQCTDGQVQI